MEESHLYKPVRESGAAVTVCCKMTDAATRACKTIYKKVRLGKESSLVWGVHDCVQMV